MWTISAKLTDGSVINDVVDFTRLINATPREKIAHLGLFYCGEYRGTIELKDPAQRLILVKRGRALYGNTTEEHYIYLVGWQSTVQGKNVKSIIELYEDGSFVLKNTDGRQP